MPVKGHNVFYSVRVGGRHSGIVYICSGQVAALSYDSESTW